MKIKENLKTGHPEKTWREPGNRRFHPTENPSLGSKLPQAAKNCKLLVNQALKSSNGGNVWGMKTIFPSIMKHKIFATVALMGVLAVGALAADVNGKYTGEMQGRNGAQTITMNFTTSGGAVTGTVSNPRGGDDMKIENGKIDGDTITFDVTMAMGDNTMVTKYTGKISGDSIEFSRAMSGGPGGGRGAGGGRGPGGGGRGPATFTVKKAS